MLHPRAPYAAEKLRYVRASRSTVNLGNPDEFSILDLAETVIRLTSSRSKIVHNSLPQDDPLQRRPDITLARKRLNWEPGVPLEDGLRKTIGYFDGTDGKEKQNLR